MGIVLRSGMIQVAIGLVVGVASTAIWERLFAEPNMLTAPGNLPVVATDHPLHPICHPCHGGIDQQAIANPSI